MSSENSGVNFGFEKSTNLILGKIETWYELVLKSLPNFIVAILVIIAFWGVAKMIRNLLSKALQKSQISQSIQQLALSFVHLTVVLLGLFVALGILHLDKTVTSLLAGAGVIGLALGFAFQEIASNFVSGVMIAIRQPFKVGDIVEVEGMMGKVSLINLRTTTIQSFQGIDMLVPNKAMFTKPLFNYTNNRRRRMDLSVGVSYGDNLEKVVEIVKSAVEGIPGRIEDKPVEIFYTEFGGSSINFDLRVWLEYPPHIKFFEFRHKAIIAIKQAFDKNDITIPFPIRTLDFGIKGGVPLQTPLQQVYGALDQGEKDVRTQDVRP